MKRFIFCILTFLSIATYGQEKKEKILYVVDSIPIFGDISEDEGTLSENTVDYLDVVTNKANFGEYKIYDFDKIIYVFTKEYAKRPDEIKKIPTVKKMYRKEGKWCLIGSPLPYSGRVIEYYSDGRIKRDGLLKDGLAEGLTNSYYKDGKLEYYRHYSKGIALGESGQYYKNGQLQQTGLFKDDKEDGIWKEWYSTGILKRETEFKGGKPRPSKEAMKVNSFFTKGLEYFDKENYTESANYYNKAIELNPNYSDLYFHRSRAYLYAMKFDDALTDCNKAIELEPLYKDAYSQRAFIRIRKYEFKDSRVLTNSKEITVYATKQNVEIPMEEQAKICSDLRKGYELGDTKQMITDTIKKYCE